MGFARKFENRMEDSLEGIADRMSNAPISPVKIAKKAEKQMQREKMVGAGKQFAPTLYTVLVNSNDDARLFGYYPTLAGETETYLAAKAESKGLIMDGQPLVRFIADDTLKSGKFEVIAEAVAAPVIEQLRMEEMQRYGIALSPAPQWQDQQNFAQYPMDNSNFYGAQAGAADAWGDYGAYESDFNAAPQAEIEPQQSPAFDNQRSEQPNMSVQAEASPDSIFAEAQAPHAQPVPQPAPQPIPQPMPQPIPQPVPTMIAPATMVMETARPATNAAGGQVPAFAKLINIATGQNHIARAARTVIGRGTSSDIMLADLNASRSHAELRCEPQGFWSLTDLNSTNGTAVNGRRITSTPLQEGDVITIGVTNLAFTLR